jgi:hypothetical protein
MAIGQVTGPLDHVMQLPGRMVWAPAGRKPRPSLGRRVRAFLGGIEPGRPVPATLVLSASPWTPVILGLFVVLFVATRLDLLTLGAATRVGSALGAPGREVMQGMPVGALEVLAAAVGLVLLFARGSAPWPTRLLIVLGTWAFATYNVGLLSWGAVQEMIVRLANQPGVDVFEAPPPGITSAGLVLAFFLLLTPVLGVVVLVMIWAWSAFVEELFKPFGRRKILPDWLLMLPFVAGFSALAYAANSVWLPWFLWVLGVVARAYVLAVG